jgi:hypothetical protein
MRRRLVFPALVVALMAFAAPARAAVITFDSVTVGQGDIITLDVRIEDVADLFTYGFDIVFDSSVVQFVSLAEGAFLRSGLTEDGEALFIPGDTTTPGLVSFIAGGIFNQAAGVSGSGILATLVFQAVAGGSAGIEIVNPLLFDSASPAGALIDTTVANGTVAVTGNVPSIPEPSTLLVVAIGLAGLRAARRRAA